MKTTYVVTATVFPGWKKLQEYITFEEVDSLDDIDALFKEAQSVIVEKMKLLDWSECYRAKIISNVVVWENSLRDPKRMNEYWIPVERDGGNFLGGSRL